MPAQKLIAKIHIAAKELRLEEETYRDILESQTGKRSAALMSNNEILKCIRRFKDLGWTPRASRLSPNATKYDDQKGDIYSASPKIKRKIEAMWHDLYRGNNEKKHLRQWLFDKFKISDVAFLDKRTAYDAVEALKKMQNRAYQYGTKQGSITS